MAFIDAPAQPLASVLEEQISGSSSVGYQADEVSRAPALESFEAEPKLGVECRPGGSSSKRPASLSPERTARDSATKRERHSVHPPHVAEEMETDSEMEEA